MDSVLESVVAMPTDREIVMTRFFDAPRQRVFACWAKPELVERWLTGQAAWVFVACDIDFSEGGAYRFEWRSQTGDDRPASGIYRELALPEILVGTATPDATRPASENSVTLVLTEEGGRTHSVNTVLYDSPQARDVALAIGLTQGVNASYDRLDALLVQLRAELGDAHAPSTALG